MRLSVLTLLLLPAVVLPSQAQANSYTAGTDAELRAALSGAANNPGSTITLTSNITITGGDLPALVNNTTINGGGYTLDGNNANRGLFAYQGMVAINNLTIVNTVAHGGNTYGGDTYLTAQQSGGGGMGAGGALFVAAGANVTITNVKFSRNSAIGGSALGATYGNGGAGGGGGMGGNSAFGGNWNCCGGGGGGLGNSATGGHPQSTGSAGIVPGAASGGNGTRFYGGYYGPVVWITPPDQAGGANGGGGGGGGAYGTGGGGGGGGGGIGGANGYHENGGNGGFGGGGGGAPAGIGGNGGFGGGGGYSDNAAAGKNGGYGGFGGGGGGGGDANGPNGGIGYGGWGGGNGSIDSNSVGGGGAGFGGAVFVQQGGSLTVAGAGSIANGMIAGGSGAQNGYAAGSGFYLQGSGTLNFAPVAGNRLVVGGSIVDDVGSGLQSTWAMGNPNAYTPGTYNVVVSGAGTLVFTGANSYSGGTTINPGATLQLGNGGSITGNVTDNGTLAFNRSNGEFNGVISGSGGVHQLGGGTTLLTAGNSYTGGTLIDTNGTLALMGAGSIAASSGVTANGTFDISTTAGGATIATLSGIGKVLLGGQTLTVDHGASTFAGSIQGGGGLAITGGTQTLSGVNSIGQTTVTGGTLVMAKASDLGGALTVNAGGRLEGLGAVGPTTVNSGGTIALSSGGALTIDHSLTLQAGSTFEYHLADPSTLLVATPMGSSVINVNGNLALNGAGLSVLGNGADPSLGYHRLIYYAGTLSETNGGLTVTNFPPSSPIAYSYTVDTTSFAHYVDLLVRSDGVNVLQLWGGGTNGVGMGNGTWNAGNSNWLDPIGGVAPTIWGSAYGIFRGPGGTVTVDGAQTAVGLQFAGGTYTLAPGTAGSLNMVASPALQIAVPGIDVLAGETATVGVTITGTDGLQKTSDGTLILGGTNTYSGGTFLSGGVLQIASDANLGATSGGVTFDSATLSTTADIASARAVNLRGAGAFDTAAGTTLSLSGNMTGAGSLTKLGDGTLALSGSNTWSGGSLITAGTLRADSAGALPTLTDYVLTGGRLDLNGYNLTMSSLSGIGGEVALGSGSLTVNQAIDSYFGGVISGTGGLTKSGSGLLMLTGNSTYGGGTNIMGGTIGIVSDSNLGAATGQISMSGGSTLLTLGNITTTRNIGIAGTSTLYTFDGTALTVAGQISGGGTLVKDGAGTLTLTGANNYSGGTTIAAGTLQLGDGHTSGSITGDVFNNGVLAFNRADISVFSGAISGVGSLQQIGAGTTVLTGNSSYGGDTLIAGGTLQLGNGGTSGWIVGNVTNNGTLAFNRSDAVIFEGAITGAGALNQIGPGLTVLTGNNSYSGGTTIAAGALMLGDGGTSGAITGNVMNNGVLAFNRSDTSVFAGAIAGTGSVQQIGTGTTELNGNSSYIGPTDIYVGRLSVNGSIASSSLTTAHGGGTLGGYGVVGPTLIDGGMLSPGNSVGTLTVQGNLTFTAPGTYFAELNSVTSDRVNVSGTATPGGATVVAVYAGDGYVKTRYTLVNAAGGVHGTFGELINTNLPASFSPSLSYDPNNVYLDLKLTYAGLSINQQSVANGLSNGFNAVGAIPLAVGGLTPAGLTLASGELATGVQQTTIDAMGMFMSTMTDPSVAGRAGWSSLDGRAALAYGPTTQDKIGAARDAFAALPGAAAAVSFDQRWSVWAAAFGGARSTGGNDIVGSHTLTDRIYGTAIGADYRLSPDTLLGFAMAGGGTGFGLANGLGSGHSDLFQAGVYAYHRIGAAYLSAALAYGWLDVTTDRTLALAGIDRLRGGFQANAFSGRLEGGYRFATPWAGLTPYAAGQFVTLDLPAHAEGVLAGDNIFALNYASRNETASLSELGLRTDKSFALDDAVLTLRGRAAWVHNFNTERSAAATFQLLPQASFLVRGAPLASDAARTTASVEMKWINGWSVAGTFEGEFSGPSTSLAGKGTVSYQW